MVITLSDEDVEMLDHDYFEMVDQDGADGLLWHAPNLVDLNFMVQSLYENYVESKFRRLSHASSAQILFLSGSSASMLVDRNCDLQLFFYFISYAKNI